jgi:hypothetical protein
MLLIKRASQSAKKDRLRSTWLNVTRVVPAQTFSGSINRISVSHPRLLLNVWIRN